MAFLYSIWLFYLLDGIGELAASEELVRVNGLVVVGEVIVINIQMLSILHAGRIVSYMSLILVDLWILHR